MEPTILKNNHKRIGQWLKAKRESAGLTQAQLASRIGRHKSFIGRYEAGGRLGIVPFIKISIILKASTDEAIRVFTESD